MSKTPKYDAYVHLKSNGVWPKLVTPEWARDDRGLMNMRLVYETVIAELASVISAPTKQLYFVWQEEIVGEDQSVECTLYSCSKSDVELSGTYPWDVADGLYYTGCVEASSEAEAILMFSGEHA